MQLLAITLAFIPFFDKLIHDNIKNGSVLLRVIPPYVAMLVVVLLITNVVWRKENPLFFYLTGSSILVVPVVIYFFVPSFTKAIMVFWIVFALLPIPFTIFLVICACVGVI